MKRMEWCNRRVIISVHEATTGPSHDLRDYLLERNVLDLLFIAHPLLFLKENFKNSSRFELYRNGKLVKKGSAYHLRAPELILYAKDFFYSIFWSMKYVSKPDLYIGIGNLNAFSGLFLKIFKRVGNVIYYVIDYVPRRFSNKIVNFVYHWIEKVCAEKCNWTWNLSPRMIEGREKMWGKIFSHQLIVPHGVHFDRIRKVPFSEVNKTEIIYMGSLLQKQGIQLVITSLPELSKKIPNVRLTIIGKGPYEQELRNLVIKYRIKDRVEFLGYVENHHEMEDRIAKAAIAIALYDKKYDQFSYFADPGKIKNYLGAGVPVIMTDVPYVAHQVEEAKCGYIIEYSQDSLLNVLHDYLSNHSVMQEYRKNALNFAKKYKWDNVFDKAFQALYNKNELDYVKK